MPESFVLRENFCRKCKKIKKSNPFQVQAGDRAGQIFFAFFSRKKLAIEKSP